MSKFFVQLLLSVMVGLSAVLGFSPNTKSELHKTWQRTNAALHEMVHTTVETVSDVSANISVEVNAETTAESHEETEASANSNLDTNVGSEDSVLDNVVPDFWLNGSSASEIQTNAEADTLGIDAGLQETSESTLDIGLTSEK